MTRRRRLGIALVVPALGLPLAASPAQAWTPPPPPTKSLPTALDVAVPYQGQTICDPVARPGVLAFAKLMTSHYGMGSTALIGRACGSDVSEHYDGRAWDWMLNVDNAQQEAVAQSVLNWLTKPDAQGRPGAMARRFGIMYIIHNRKMWRAYAPERGWADYYGVSPHTDHIHFSFTYDGAAGRTSWWTGKATTSYLTSLPPATPGSVITVPTTPTVLSYGMTSEAVRTLQARLGNLPTTGYYGTMTRARVIEYQRFVGLPQTGTADLKTQAILADRGWKSISAAYPTLQYGMTSERVRTVQRLLGSLPTTAWYGPMTRARVSEFQKYQGLAQTGIADARTQQLLWTRGWTRPATTTTYPTLSYGMTSEAVRRLQAALGNLPTTAWFGPMTQARVKEYQKFMGLTVTGVADSKTQQLLYTRGWSTAAPAAYTTTPTEGSAVVSPAVATVSSDTAYTPYKDVVLAAGTRGGAVRTLQRGLGGIGVDGVFGPLTERAVMALQRSEAMPVTGVVTPELWDVLERRDFPFVGNRSTVLRLGDSGPAVSAIQRVLGVPVTGRYDGVTKEAVKRAQAGAGLASTGVVASRTWSLFDRLSA